MNVSALNPAAASLLQAIHRKTSAAEAVAPEQSAPAPKPAAATGSGAVDMSSETMGSLLTAQEVKAPNNSSWYGEAMKSYDLDQNGKIDEAEYQKYLDIGHKALGDEAIALDIRQGPSGVSSKQVYPDTITLVPSDATKGS